MIISSGDIIVFVLSNLQRTGTIYNINKSLHTKNKQSVYAKTKTQITVQ